MHVCVHARESGYHKESGIDSQSHRNADILSFVPAMRFLVDRGFTVVRMGDPTMHPLPPMEGVIDYCHHPARDPWLDIYLVASAQFFVGCMSRPGDGGARFRYSNGPVAFRSGVRTPVYEPRICSCRACTGLSGKPGYSRSKGP